MGKAEGKGKDGIQNGKITAGCSGITILVALITMIVAAVGMKLVIDPAVMKACGNAPGAYTTDCSDPKAPVDPKAATTTTTRRALFVNPVQLQSSIESMGESLVAKATFKKNEQTRHFQRLLTATVGDDTCATAEDYSCQDKTMWEYSTYSSSECAAGTDTKDCDGIYKGSNCKAGECCCTCKSFSSTAADITLVAAIPDLSYADPLMTDDSSSYPGCDDTKCKAHCKTEGAKDANSGLNLYTNERYIHSQWNKENPKNVVLGGCVNSKCCGIDKFYSCGGTSEMDDANTQELFAKLTEFAVYACLSGIIGVLPAMVGGFAKATGRDNLGNTMGGISLCTTCIFGFAGSGGAAAYLMLLSALVSVYCSAAKQMLAEAGTDLASTCDAACLGALNHQVDAFCNAGTSVGTVGMMCFMVAACGFVTLILTCVGFCNNKQQAQTVIIVQGGQQQVQVVPQANGVEMVKA